MTISSWKECGHLGFADTSLFTTEDWLNVLQKLRRFKYPAVRGQEQVGQSCDLESFWAFEQLYPVLWRKPFTVFQYMT